MNPIGHHQPDSQPQQPGADRQPGIDKPASRPARPQKQRGDRERQQHRPGNTEHRLGHRMPRLAPAGQPGAPKAVVNPSRA